MEAVKIRDATLYHGDCRELAVELAAGAVVTDPPYGIDFTQRTTGEKIVGDDEDFDPSPWLGRECLLWGANHYAHRLPAGGSYHVWLKRAVEIAAPKSYSDVEFVWLSKPKHSKCIRLISDGCIREGKEFGHRRVHPSQKPIEVMEWCLSFVDADLIVDPYMGSGTTGMACAQMGRAFVGVEIERRYFDIACERIERAYQQQRLFA